MSPLVLDTTALPGSEFPLGATPRTGGTNFAVVSGSAEAMTLCLFDESGTETQIPLQDYDGGVWHAFVRGVGPGQAYGFRAAGPYDSARGLRFNPAKLLVDPYARAISGDVRFGPKSPATPPGTWTPPATWTRPGSCPEAWWWTPASSGPPAPGRRAGTRRRSSTKCTSRASHDPSRCPCLSGAYAGLAHEAPISHLVDLGVTSVELLPVHHSVPEQFLLDRGLTNYWGYNTIGFFAPHEAYSAAGRAGRPGGQVAEFKAMVDALHGAGLEVILDVVFNHTAEADRRGPTLCFRGLDNPAYYRLSPTIPGYTSIRRAVATP